MWAEEWMWAGTAWDSGDGVACRSDVAVAGSSVGEGVGDTATVAVGRCSPQPTATATASIRKTAVPAPRNHSLGITILVLLHPVTWTLGARSKSS